VSPEDDAYEFADAQVLENVLENGVRLDVVVRQPSMDEGVVLIVIEAVADGLGNPKEWGKKGRAFLAHWFTNRKSKQLKATGKLQYTYPESSHRGAVVLVQQIAQVLDLGLVNTQLLNHVIWNEWWQKRRVAGTQLTELLDSKKKTGSNSRRTGTSPSMFFLTWPAIPALSGYRVSSRSVGENRSEKPLHSVRRQSRGRRKQQDGTKIWQQRAATFSQEAEQRLTEEQAVELGLLDLVAAVFELHVWGLWWRASCREESRLAGSPNTSPDN
jgi:hypothetical protein